MNKKAEVIRIRYLYRSLVLKEKIRLPLKAALKMVGPDCAYHLYPKIDFNDGHGTRKGKKGNSTLTKHSP